jgi:hypothetical protein
MSENRTMMKTVSHNRSDEKMEAKVRSLSLAERMDLLCAFTDMILSVNPQVAEKRNAQPIAGRILVLART